MMDQSIVESDISMSPSQILERLQMLRKLQLLQRGQLQKQRLQYQDSPEPSSSTEVLSHFTNSTSYNTFRSLLQSSSDAITGESPSDNLCRFTQKLKNEDVMEGVSILNLSQESEFLVNSPISSKSLQSANNKSPQPKESCTSIPIKKNINLDEMPILSPKDFQSLLLEKLQSEKQDLKVQTTNDNVLQSQSNKKPFLRKGEGLTRFGVSKGDLIIQNTKSLPWRKGEKNKNPKDIINSANLHNNEDNNVKAQIHATQSQKLSNKEQVMSNAIKDNIKVKAMEFKENETPGHIFHSNDCKSTNDQKRSKSSESKHPVIATKSKTWAAILTNEQDNFLRQLKQSDYYKNFTSPSKSSISEISCREAAEQNMFELLEEKVSNNSFSLQNSFFHRFLQRSNLEYSGESTPLTLQKCLANNPNLLHIFPGPNKIKNKSNTTNSDVDFCESECTDCDHETCSSVSSCCSCKTVEETKIATQDREVNKNKPTSKPNPSKVLKKESEKQLCEKENTVTENDILKVNMAEMNAKLVATSELLKDRLQELEDEIETFRKENANLTKLREEVDLERQKIYEEKSTFEQKFNEEKILYEYHLAEEKERLTKQKQIYERYVREMRGRLSKKERDEVISLKKEIEDLKNEIRIKDAKSTSTIARLRNQLKIMEKEKNNIKADADKLRKENKRLQHSNDITRRMTNIKYLEQINKRLSSINTKETQSEVNVDKDIKYKSHEIERQSRSRKVQSSKTCIRPRAKSVPNLKVTSRYAKYFSQRDSISQMDENKSGHIDRFDYKNEYNGEGFVDDLYDKKSLDNSGSSNDQEETSEMEVDNNLEKLYLERFKSASPQSSKCSSSRSNSLNNLTTQSFLDVQEQNSGFFIQKSSSCTNSQINSKPSNCRSTSPYLSTSSSLAKSTSPISVVDNVILSNTALQKSNYLTHSGSRSKSPVSILCNKSSKQKSPNMVDNDATSIGNQEPCFNKTSLTKTNLNPTEIKRPDGGRELRFPNGNVKYISADGKYIKFDYYNGDIKENFLLDGRIKYFYAETKTYHTTHPDGLEVLEFSDGQIEKRYKDGSSEIRLPNGSIRYHDPKNIHVREEWRFPDGSTMIVAANGEQRVTFTNGQIEVHAKDHKRREFPDGTVKLVYNDGTAETRYASGRVRIKDKHGNLIMDSAPG